MLHRRIAVSVQVDVRDPRKWIDAHHRCLVGLQRVEQRRYRDRAVALEAADLDDESRRTSERSDDGFEEEVVVHAVVARVARTGHLEQRLGGRGHTCLGALTTEYAPTSRPVCRRYIVVNQDADERREQNTREPIVKRLRGRARTYKTYVRTSVGKPKLLDF